MVKDLVVSDMVVASITHNAKKSAVLSDGMIFDCYFFTNSTINTMKLKNRLKEKYIKLLDILEEIIGNKNLEAKANQIIKEYKERYGRNSGKPHEVSVGDYLIENFKK